MSTWPSRQFASIPCATLYKGSQFRLVFAAAGQTLLWSTALLGLIFITLPVVAILARAMATNYDSSFHLTNPVLIRAIGLSVATTLVSMGCVILLGLPLAYVLARYQFPFKAVPDFKMTNAG